MKDTLKVNNDRPTARPLCWNKEMLSIPGDVAWQVPMKMVSGAAEGRIDQTVVRGIDRSPVRVIVMELGEGKVVRKVHIRCRSQTADGRRICARPANRSRAPEEAFGDNAMIPRPHPASWRITASGSTIIGRKAIWIVLEP